MPSLAQREREALGRAGGSSEGREVSSPQSPARLGSSYPSRLIPPLAAISATAQPP